MKKITIVYAISDDEFYTRIASISALSVALTAAETHFIDLYILVSKEYSKERALEFQSLIQCANSKCHVSFIASEYQEEMFYSYDDYITKETYYRLFLPEILRDCDKCIYLDADTIVCHGIQDLYDLIHDDAYILGVKAPSFHRFLGDEYASQAMLPDMQRYINAGVLGMNLKLMRENKITDRIREVLKKKMACGDQDCINSVCYEKITLIPYKYNLMTKYASWNMEDYAGIFDYEEVDTAWNDPYIIHYADREKPWNSLRCPMGERWWTICRKSGYFEYFFNLLKEQFYIEALYHNGGGINNGIRSTVYYPCMNDSFNRRYVLYGAGRRAEKVLKWLKKMNLSVSFIIVSDMMNNPDEIGGVPVRCIDDVENNCKEFTLIIAMLEKHHANIIRKIDGILFREIIFLNDNWDYN